MTPSPFKEATGSIALVGAPDKSIGDPNAATSATQAFCVQLVQGLTKEMKDHIRHGKAHVVLGSNAVDLHNLAFFLYAQLTCFDST